MNLYRVFDWDNSKKHYSNNPGSPVYIPRDKQGRGRHDIPQIDGIFYCSLSSHSAMAEQLYDFMNIKINDSIFNLSNGWTQALAEIEMEDNIKLADLNDSKLLVKYDIKPSEIITSDIEITQRIAKLFHEEKYDGIKWFSSIESCWTNVSLFASRTHGILKKSVKAITPLSIRMQLVRETCDLIKVKY